MHKVAFVKPSRQKGYTVIGIDCDGEIKRFTLPQIFYAEIGLPVRGEKISDAVFCEILHEDEMFRALKRALSLLSYADNNERTLTLKLLRAGFSRAAVEYAVRDCVGHGYIKEKEQLLRLVSSLANSKLRGPLYIRQYLAAKGYKISEIDDAIDELTLSDEIDFKESFNRLAEKMGAADSEGRRILAYKYGFRST